MRSTSKHLEYGVYYFFEYFGLYTHSNVWNVRTCFGRPCSRIRLVHVQQAMKFRV